MDTRIRQFVYRVRGRLREQLVIDNLIKCVGLGMLIAVLISLIALAVPFYYAIVVATVVLVVSFLVGIIWGIGKTPSPMQAALRADAKGYQEKLSTAFFLQGKEDAFSVLQKKDALRIVEQFSIRKEFPIRVPWKTFALMLALTVVFVVSSLIDTPAKQTANMQHEVSKKAKEEIARLEKIEKKLEKNEELVASEVAEVEELLENAKKELKEAESYEDLQKAKERANKKMEMASREIKDQTLGEMLQQAVAEAEELAKEEEEKLAEEAKEALDKASNGTEKDKRDAYEKLKKLAAATGDEQLAQAAESYKASEYSDGDYANATQALNQTMQQMSNSDYAQNTNQNSSNQNSSNQNASNQNGNQNTNNQNNAQGANSQGNNQSNQNGNQAGNGQGDNGQPGNNGGYGNGQNGHGSQGGGWNYGGREGQEGARKTKEDITVPDGEVGDDEDLTGKANGNDSSTTQKSNKSRTWSGNKVNYDEVSGEYKNKAYKKVDGSNYPEKMRDRIRDYFDGLN